jgi:hypothetical protein
LQTSYLWQIFHTENARIGSFDFHVNQLLL